jgi:lipoprotein-releasing system permease protein
MEKRIMSLLLGLIVIVAVFNIISALSMMVSEKQGEVAILQTLGFTPQMIAKVFMAQGMYNGIFGTLIGVAGGLLLSKPLITESATINTAIPSITPSVEARVKKPIKPS